MKYLRLRIIGKLRQRSEIFETEVQYFDLVGFFIIEENNNPEDDSNVAEKKCLAIKIKMQIVRNKFITSSVLSRTIYSKPIYYKFKFRGYFD